MERLRRRADFVAVARGRRTTRQAFVLQARTGAAAGAKPGEKPARIGFTVIKKIGNAVERNRIRRRLRAAVRQVESHAEDATDYVVVARRPALTLNFQRLVTDLTSGFDALSRQKAPQTGTDAR